MTPPFPYNRTWWEAYALTCILLIYFRGKALLVEGICNPCLACETIQAMKFGGWVGGGVKSIVVLLQSWGLAL